MIKTSAAYPQKSGKKRIETFGNVSI